MVFDLNDHSCNSYRKPRKLINFLQFVTLVGEDEGVPVIDSNSQTQEKTMWSMADFVDYLKTDYRIRPKILNVISMVGTTLKYPLIQQPDSNPFSKNFHTPN